MSKKKKILIFIDWFLPGYKAGGPIRSVANIIEHLSNEFEFEIVTSNTDYSEKEPYKNIESDKWVSFQKNVFVFYFSEKNFSAQNLKKLIKNTDFDIAYINGIYSFRFSILPLYFLKKTRKKIIVASRGMLSKHAFSSKSFKKSLFLKAAKLFGLYKKVVFQATEPKEADDIKKIIKKYKTIFVVPNLPKKIKNQTLRRKKKDKGILKLASIARISPEKNTLFALEILNQFQFSGKIVFDLYGSVHNENYWRQCKQIIENLPKNIGVNFNGSIESEKVFDIFSDAHFAFMPSQGENFGHSILESFSAGCPVIISDQTPWRNLEEKQIGWDIALSDKQKFRDVIQKCIDMKQDEYDIMSKNAFNFAKEFAENPEIKDAYFKLFNVFS